LGITALSGWHVKDYGSIYRWVLPGKETLSLSWPAPNIQMTKYMLQICSLCIGLEHTTVFLITSECTAFLKKVECSLFSKV